MFNLTTVLKKDQAPISEGIVFLFKKKVKLIMMLSLSAAYNSFMQYFNAPKCGKWKKIKDYRYKTLENASDMM